MLCYPTRPSLARPSVGCGPNWFAGPMVICLNGGRRRRRRRREVPAAADAAGGGSQGCVGVSIDVDDGAMSNE